MSGAAVPARQPLEDAVSVDVLKAEVRAWASRIGVELREIQARPMRRKWASCSSRGRVSLNVDLLREPAEFRTEVIVHELLHLKVPNHGALFRSLLRAHLARGLAQPSSGRAVDEAPARPR